MKIQQLKNIFPHIQVARYNLAAWNKIGDGSVYFIGREVETAGAVGEPDTGVLKLFEIEPDGKIAEERVIWRPEHEGVSLEDPRALELADESLVIGLTAVLRNLSGQPVPFPAIVKINAHGSWKKELPPFLIISTFGPGKNLTPIGDDTFLFRPDAPEYHHRLLVFSIVHQVPERLSDIQFPTNLSWAKWRIGTTMPPIWLTPNEALFIVHGISIETINGHERYIYSIGRAKLTRKDHTFEVQVAPEPILTPDDFLNQDGMPLVKELHPELRRVVYSCGGILNRKKPDTLSLYVNVGDRSTFEVEFSMNELKADLFN